MQVARSSAQVGAKLGEEESRSEGTEGELEGAEGSEPRQKGEENGQKRKQQAHFQSTKVLLPDLGRAS